MSVQVIKQFLTKGYVHPRMFLLAGLRSYSTTTSEIPAAANDEPIAMNNPFQRERKQCILCQMNVHPNYKNVRLLSQFQSQYTGRIYGRHITGLCQTQQERVEREITRAQRAGYMGSYNKSVEFVQDPRLFDPERPIRPHNY